MRRLPLRIGVLSLEEAEGRVVARLRAADADMSRVEVFGTVTERNADGTTSERPWRLPKDCEALGIRIAELGLDLVVIDGLGYAVTGDSHNYANVGAAVTALGSMAAGNRCAVFGIMHPPKGDADPSGPAIGSVAWTTVARNVHLLGPDPADESHERRVVAVGPTNYKPPAPALSFRLPEGKYECAVVADVATSNTTAGDLLARPMADEAQSKLDEAREWLAERLKPHGTDHASADVKADAGREGITARTLQRARSELRVIVDRKGEGRDHRSTWRIDSCQPTTENIGTSVFGTSCEVPVTRDNMPDTAQQSGTWANPQGGASAQQHGDFAPGTTRNATARPPPVATTTRPAEAQPLTPSTRNRATVTNKMPRAATAWPPPGAPRANP